MTDRAGHTVYGNLRLRGHTSLCDLRVAGGRITEIGPAGGIPDVDLGGALVVPGLVEAHLHLEKAYLLDRMPREATSLADAISMTSDLKATFTATDIRNRSLRLIRSALSCGVTTIRAQVEIDDVLGLTAVETILALRDELRSVLDLQVVAFPQDGLTSQRHARTLLAEALEAGADVVGGIPYADDDPDEHLDFVFNAAVRTGAPIDLHLDFSDDPAELNVLGVVERTRKHGMQGRVTVGHLTSLGRVEPELAREIADLIAEAGISVVTLPMTDVYLNGRTDPTAASMGLTPVRMLIDAGVNVAVATNNVQNPFTPYGRGRITDSAMLLAGLCHFGSASEAETVVDMMTVNAARAVGLTDRSLTVGAPATFAAFDAHEARDLICDADRAILVVRDGNQVTPEDLPR